MLYDVIEDEEKLSIESRFEHLVITKRLEKTMKNIKKIYFFIARVMNKLILASHAHIAFISSY